MLSWALHTADWGIPLTVYTNKGTQLVSAGPMIGNKEESLDWAKIVVSQGITWRTCPAGAQFHNGASKAVVKKAKRTFQHIYGEAKLTALETETVLKRVLAILNSRLLTNTHLSPDGWGQTEDSLLPKYAEPLTPNYLLIG